MSRLLELIALDWHALGLVALAAGLGALIGLEREVAAKPAGLRTHIFVCAGAALLMLLGDVIVSRFSNQESQGIVTADPIRVIQAIVIGISFLGAGTIVHQGGSQVEGLTTAASIFLTAGVGIAVAVERIGLAAGTTLFAVVVLLVVGWLEKLIERRRGRTLQGNRASPTGDSDEARAAQRSSAS